MWINKQDLSKQLADMSLTEIQQLRTDALVRRAEEEQRKARHRLNDPSGTVRYDTENDMFLVRVDGEEDESPPYWTAYLNEGYGIPVEDSMIKPAGCPVIGQLP